MLGNLYRHGDSCLEKSPKRTFQLHELAAVRGHAKAQFQLGYSYGVGQGTKINHETAAQWYRRAADQGYPGAQNNLGTLFAARAWRSRAAKTRCGGGSPEAVELLAAACPGRPK
mmetsp:Transcript_11978/g.39968  ORF Transcript_11978/g.39968 Transcript_11978/m.39968 type:complete len:114 (+) Transcript_11978:234-575(+)